MKCPDCSETLVMSDRSAVEIDYWPRCRGVWRDRGELDDIVERSSAAQREMYHPGPERRRCEEDQYKNRKKKKDSFLGGLFDF